MTASEPPHGRSRYRHQGCRCDVCIEANRLYMRELRARKRGLRPVPTLPTDPNESGAVADVRQDAAPDPNGSPGPCVAAVRADVERLGVAQSERAMRTAAEAMAHILDNPLLATTQPPACGKLLDHVGAA
jgi:hypothetical protein